MEMYRCVDCGHLFEEGEQAQWEESRGEFWGRPCSELADGCPMCHGDYEAVHECEGCGLFRCDKHETFCEQCRDDLKKRFEEMLHKEFTDTEIAELNEIFDGEYFG